VNPIFLVLCLIMFWVFYQKGLKFFQALGHGKWRSRFEGALIGFLVGFAFPIGVILYGVQRKPPAAPSSVSASASGTPGSAPDTAERATPDAVEIPE
jgi:hypothetical protein